MVSEPLLRVEGLEVAYGEVQVLWGLDLAVAEQEVVALVGSNGAGKTTTLKALAGALRPRAGRIVFEGRDITGRPAADAVRTGIVLVPEGRQLFAGMSVHENLMMGAYARQDGMGAIRQDLDWVYELFRELAKKRGQLAGTLSGGEQQMCAIGRGLMAKPRLLLLDELSLGLAPVIVDRLVEIVTRIHRERGLAILLVEQDLNVALAMAGRGYVLETGRLVRSGAAEELLADEAVRAAYLGM
ncbi:MAG: ABC transporter ATP-binding protein [Firmicutes bacterium]|nr:ABC transporter ATP-binding protein [Bacillota bacterium]